MSKQWLESFEPNPDPLLNLLGSQIDDAMLREIAAADYGNDLEEHLRPLKAFRDEGVVPALDWNPREVLELIRWSEPEDKGWKPGGHGRYGHLLRAFACSALLRSYEAEENRDNDRWHSFNETAVQLADSLTALGDQFVAVGIRFFGWCVEHLAPLDEDGVEPPFLGFALLYLALKRRKTKDEAVISLCNWIDDSVSTLLQQNQWCATRKFDWLLSTNFHNLKNNRWIEIGREFYRWAEAQPKSEKATWVALIGRSLSEDKEG